MPDISYIYDELVGLDGVVDLAGETGIYTYDAVGNLLSIEQRSSSARLDHRVHAKERTRWNAGDHTWHGVQTKFRARIRSCLMAFPQRSSRHRHADCHYGAVRGRYGADHRRRAQWFGHEHHPLYRDRRS